MKKNIIFVILFLALFYTGCSKGEPALTGNYRLVSMNTTSTLDSKKDDYRLANLVDGTSQGWQEGMDGDGTGVKFTYELNKTIVIKKIFIKNGYGSRKYFKQNNRVKELEISNELSDKSDKKKFTVIIKDQFEPQEIALKNEIAGNRISFMIKSVYKGSKWDDTPITELWFKPLKISKRLRADIPVINKPYEVAFKAAGYDFTYKLLRNGNVTLKTKGASACSIKLKGGSWGKAADGSVFINQLLKMPVCSSVELSRTYFFDSLDNAVKQMKMKVSGDKLLDAFSNSAKEYSSITRDAGKQKEFLSNFLQFYLPIDEGKPDAKKVKVNNTMRLGHTVEDMYYYVNYIRKALYTALAVQTLGINVLASDYKMDREAFENKDYSLQLFTPCRSINEDSIVDDAVSRLTGARLVLNRMEFQGPKDNYMCGENNGNFMNQYNASALKKLFLKFYSGPEERTIGIKNSYLYNITVKDITRKYVSDIVKYIKTKAEMERMAEKYIEHLNNRLTGSEAGIKLKEEFYSKGKGEESDIYEGSDVVGFLTRRTYDSTLPVIFELASVMLSEYDPVFYSRVKSRLGYRK